MVVHTVTPMSMVVSLGQRIQWPKLEVQLDVNALTDAPGYAASVKQGSWLC